MGSAEIREKWCHRPCSHTSHGLFKPVSGRQRKNSGDVMGGDRASSPHGCHSRAAQHRGLFLGLASCCTPLSQGGNRLIVPCGNRGAIHSGTQDASYLAALGLETSSSIPSDDPTIQEPDLLQRVNTTTGRYAILARTADSLLLSLSFVAQIGFISAAAPTSRH